jgi:hypothetical protein
MTRPRDQRPEPWIVAALLLGGLWALDTLTARAFAQSYAFGYAEYAVPGAQAVISADFNRDGKPDLAVTSANCQPDSGSAAPCVSILLGKPDGTFARRVDYAVGTSPIALAAGDFNGDGGSDLAVVNSGDNTVSILLNNGDGTFGPHVDYPTASGPQWVATGDFNGDGKLDLAVATSSNAVSILLGNGDGTFKPHTDYPSGSNWVFVADLNGDGKLDLIVGNTLLFGNGDGSFQLPQSFPGNPSYGPPALGDFNGDGKLDVAVAYYPPPARLCRLTNPM